MRDMIGALLRAAFFVAFLIATDYVVGQQIDSFTLDLWQGISSALRSSVLH